MDKRM